MGITRWGLSLLAVWALSVIPAADAKELFLCDDGTTVLLTDNASLGCPVYKPRAELITVPDGSTWADVEWAVALKLAEQAPPRTSAFAATPREMCQEWVDINLRTEGGLDMKTDEDTRRWLALSRIVTFTNLCEHALNREMYPSF